LSNKKSSATGESYHPHAKKNSLTKKNKEEKGFGRAMQVGMRGRLDFKEHTGEQSLMTTWGGKFPQFGWT